MAILSEDNARRVHFEDGYSGRFWESRYKCRELVGHHSLLLCGIGVDLNAIKAGEARSPKTARYTSAYQQIQALTAQCRTRSYRPG